MATGHPRNFYRLSGRLVRDPTNLASAFPHGGVAQGEARSIRFELAEDYAEISAEEYGGRVVEYVRRGPAGALAAILREWDPDALAAVFPHVAAGASSGKPVLSGRAFGAGAVKAGALASDKSLKLLVSPLDPNYQQAILLHQAIPLADAAAALQAELGTEAGLAVVFRATPRSDGLLYQVGLLEDLTL